VGQAIAFVACQSKSASVAARQAIPSDGLPLFFPDPSRINGKAVSQTHLLHLAAQSGRNLLIPHKAMPSSAKS
jgi:hypothetical protein